MKMLLLTYIVRDLITPAVNIIIPCLYHTYTLLSFRESVDIIVKARSDQCCSYRSGAAWLAVYRRSRLIH